LPVGGAAPDSVDFTGNFGTATYSGATLTGGIGTLVVNGSGKTLDIRGAIDGTTNRPGEIVVNAGAMLQLTAAQANALSITGAGSVEVYDLGTTPVDLTAITVSGTKHVFLEDQAPVGDANVTLANTTKLGSMTVVLKKDDAGTPGDNTDDIAQTVTFTDNAFQADGRTVTTDGTGSATPKVILDFAGVSVDVTGYTVDVLELAATQGTFTLTGAAVARIPELVVNAGSEASISAAQATGMTVSGAGDVAVTALQGTTSVDLSNVEPLGTVTLALTEDVVLTSGAKIGQANLSVTHVALAGVVDAASSDTVLRFSSVTSTLTTGDTITFSFDGVNYATTIGATAGSTATDVEVQTAVEAAVGGGTALGAGEISVSFAGADLVLTSDNLAKTFTAGSFDNGSSSLDITAVTNPSWEVTLTELVTVGTNSELVLRAAQADGRDIGGAGAVTVTAIVDTLAADLSTVVPIGGVTLELASATTTLGLAKFGDTHLTLANTAASGSVTLDATAATFGFRGKDDDIIVGANTVLRIKASQAEYVDVGNDGPSADDTGPGSIVGEGAVVITVIDQSLTADLSNVAPAGGVTIELSDNAAFTGELGDTNFTLKSVAGSFTLDVTAADLNLTGGDDSITVEAGTTLRLSDDQADRGTSDVDGPASINGAGNVVVVFSGTDPTDLSHVTATGTITLIREAPATIEHTVMLSSTGGNYILSGDAALDGDFVLQIAVPTDGAARITGFTGGRNPVGPVAPDSEKSDVLDFSNITAVTGQVVEISKAVDLAANPLERAGLVLFRSGSAESAETIEASFSVSLNNDFVIDGSVNDLLAASSVMIFGVRTTDLAGNDVVNFWLWNDEVGNGAGIGTVQASELTLLASLSETSMTTLDTANFLILPAEPA
jgi:hypothetical protein